MKIVLMGTDHMREEDGIEICLEYDLEDTWTFSSDKFDFSISDVGKVMSFLLRMSKIEGAR